MNYHINLAMDNIPKTIHYCWFGNGSKNKMIEKCIRSWKKFFPDYEIIEWNETNFDINKNLYCKEAYENSKWAFVSDYARLDIIYKYGGIYFDTDVEVLKRFDHLLTEHGYLCFEHTSNVASKNRVNTGLGFAAKAGSEVVASMLHEYDNIHFITNKEKDMTPCPVRNTNALLKKGLVLNGSMQIIGDMKVYPYDYFCGSDIANSHPHITHNTYTVHHYSATWKDKPSLGVFIKYQIIALGMQKILGYKRYDKIIALRQKSRRHNK